MSTDDNYPQALTAAIAANTLIPLGVPLSTRDQKCRRIYLSPLSVEWARRVLPTAKTDGFNEGATSPKEQLFALSRRFCAGKDFHLPLPHLMRPNDHEIWRFKTADLRLVGWFASRCLFIVSEIELKHLCSSARDEELLDNARQLRNKLSVNDPNFLWDKLNDCL